MNQHGINPLLQERLERLSIGARIFPYGISFLDDVTGGISPHDLTVIAAGTGIGKTEIACALALEATRRNKRVLFYALEGRQFEMHSRIKYRWLSHYIFTRPKEFPEALRHKFNFRDWMHGNFDTELNALEHLADEKLLPMMERLQIETPPSDLTAHNIVELAKEMGDGQADLIILDHLHYLGWGDERSEYNAVKNAVSTIRQFVDNEGVPVVMFSHLRKSDKRQDSWVPTIEELHGSSEISKRANFVFTLSPARKLVNYKNEEIEAPSGTTLMRCVKARLGGVSCQRFVAASRFDFTTNSYSQNYFVFETDKWATKIKSVTRGEFKPWMESGREFV